MSFRFNKSLKDTDNLSPEHILNSNPFLKEKVLAAQGNGTHLKTAISNKEHIPVTRFITKTKTFVVVTGFVIAYGLMQSFFSMDPYLSQKYNQQEEEKLKQEGNLLSNLKP